MRTTDGSRGPTVTQAELAGSVCVALLGDPLLDLIHRFGDWPVRRIE